jgi:predicted HD phosphohydrolase
VTNAFGTVAELVTALAAGARETDGEAVDALAHHLQCAAILADAAPGDPELQVAGLVHDVASTLRPGRPRTHARDGAALVAPLLGERIAWLVGHHDQAKRYLVTTEPTYRSLLSECSVRTLEAQGGLLDDGELAALRAEPSLDAVLEVRRADDAAKVPGRRVPGLERWLPTLEEITRRT